jgi:hypothetical protein
MATSKQLGKSELKRLIAARLRLPGTKNKEFVELANLLITIKGGRGRAIIADETSPVTAPGDAEPDVNELVRKIEQNRKGK